MKPKYQQRRSQLASTAPADYVSPHHNDGGWHGSSIGSIEFDTLWEPLFDRLLVKRISAPAGAGMIVAPENAGPQSETYWGVVLRVGPGRRLAGNWREREWIQSKPGDVVIFGPFTDWDSFGEDVVLIQERDIRVFVSRGVNRLPGFHHEAALPSAADLDAIAAEMILAEKEETHGHTKQQRTKKAAR